MSPATFAFWADSASLVSDTLNTCVVAVNKDGASITYTVDMQRGVIISMTVYSNYGSAYHQYYYGYKSGIHFLNRVTFGGDSTIQTSGGYDFFNIRINNEQFTPVVFIPYKGRHRPAYEPGETVLSPKRRAGSGYYDLLGRRSIIDAGMADRINGRSMIRASGKYLFKPDPGDAAGGSTVVAR